MKTGVEIIAEERERQIKDKGWTIDYDMAANPSSELSRAAACYALPRGWREIHYTADNVERPSGWPFAAKWWKPTPDDRIRELAKAGALIAAEIDRLNNAKQK